MARIWAMAVIGLAIAITPQAAAEQPPAHPPATEPQVQQAVARAITYVQAESAAWLATRKCTACHHVPLPLWALSEAERNGYAIDKKFVAETIEHSIGSMDKMIAAGLFNDPTKPPDPRPQGRGLNPGIVFMAVAARELPELTAEQQESLDQITADILKKQQPDGSWEFFLSRPPINESQTTDTAWIIMALQNAAPSGRGPGAIGRAVRGVDKRRCLARGRGRAGKSSRQGLQNRPGHTREASRATNSKQRSTRCWPCNVPKGAGVKMPTCRLTLTPPVRRCTHCRWSDSQPGGPRFAEPLITWLPRKRPTAVGP